MSEIVFCLDRIGGRNKLWNLQSLGSGGLTGSAFGFGPGDPGPIRSLCVTYLCFFPCNVRPTHRVPTQRSKPWLIPKTSHCLHDVICVKQDHLVLLLFAEESINHSRKRNSSSIDWITAEKVIKKETRYNQHFSPDIGWIKNILG